MPEGHTIHRLARDHHRWFAGQRCAVSSPQGRFAREADLIDGQRFVRAEAWGKHLFHHWDGDLVVHVHLGLIGSFRMRKHPMPPPRGALRLRIEGDARGVDLRGPMTCRLLFARDLSQVTANLGPDPLRDDADPDEAWDRFRRKRSSVGAALMDQAVLAGIGNVYRAEILFKLGIHPDVPSRAIDRETFDRLWDLTKAELEDGVRLRRIVTVDPAEAGVRTKRDLPRHRQRYVYKRRTCLRCGAPVRRWDLSGRVAWACERCQQPP